MLEVRPCSRLEGTASVPGDKSVSHRAAIVGALAQGETTVHGFLESEDCLATLHCLSQLGVSIERLGPGAYNICGRGGLGFEEPSDVLDCGNSGTTMRLLAGLLASQPFFSVLTGDASLRTRPMARVIRPLESMGARICGRQSNTKAPLAILGTSPLRGISYMSPTASAQVKSAILLAGLAAEGKVSIQEPALSRNHTELMLEHLGVPVVTKGSRITMEGGVVPKGSTIQVPGDISSAAFPMVAAAIIPNSDVVLQNVGVNPTRRGIIEVLLAMGADMTVSPMDQAGEPRASIHIRGSSLRGIRVEGPIIPTLIDELPAIAVAAAYAQGTTVIKDAGELRVKECDRIAAMTQELSRLGVDIIEKPDGWVIQGHGGAGIKGGRANGFGDHRVIMALAVLGLGASSPLSIGGAGATEISFPGFTHLFGRLGASMEVSCSD
ncbi:MAG: 3-phosphoshikimate 1-carboxyvinyltransferase [Firmicutes bacterium]|nr:3-phosphoshikimate 1-carboxyvinyltransferase [Bacillota bacterium]